MTVPAAGSAPDAITPLLGYRTWLVDAEGGVPVLVSYYERSFRWPPQRAVAAECPEEYVHTFAIDPPGAAVDPSAARPDAASGGQLWRRIRPVTTTATLHHPPEWACSCGIYAALDLDRALEVAQRSRGRRCVVGVVAGWGRVLLHEHGWRSQYAAPAALLQCWVLSPLQRRLIRKLAGRYGLPVLTVRSDLEAYRQDVAAWWYPPPAGRPFR